MNDYAIIFSEVVVHESTTNILTKEKIKKISRKIRIFKNELTYTLLTEM